MSFRRCRDRRRCLRAICHRLVFELNVWQRIALGAVLSKARRRKDSVSIHHDDVNPTHPLLVDCLAGEVLRGLAENVGAAQRSGLLLVADGQGDATTRADSYRLMRLLWEQTGVDQAEVGFVRHLQPFLPNVLKRCLREPVTWFLAATVASGTPSSTTMQRSLVVS